MIIADDFGDLLVVMAAAGVACLVTVVLASVLRRHLAYYLTVATGSKYMVNGMGEITALNCWILRCAVSCSFENRCAVSYSTNYLSDIAIAFFFGGIKINVNCLLTTSLQYTWQ